MDRTSSEPLLWRGALTALIVAIGALVISFLPDLSDEQKGAITAAVAALGSFAAAFWGRGAVTPIESPHGPDGELLVPEGVYETAHAATPYAPVEIVAEIDDDAGFEHAADEIDAVPTREQ